LPQRIAKPSEFNDAICRATVTCSIITVIACFFVNGAVLVGIPIDMAIPAHFEAWLPRRISAPPTELDAAIRRAAVIPSIITVIASFFVNGAVLVGIPIDLAIPAQFKARLPRRIASPPELDGAIR
jgi:hypothetical protein